ncbi:multipass membrane protein [Oleiphilus messinensis]|uniref:Multipass membrane protein n=1 Tax=Oleiphilus messinensis TaxID=141451 RepID=A0A1Y0IIV8_9GAMM|nr:hypothetical protein [Oleiphilus messinensis]ARU59324.1 multipass membrane protein [Oleiphilus messinensis]
MSNLKMPKLSDIPYPELSNDPQKAVSMLGKIMGIDSHLIKNESHEDLAPILAGLFYYRFLKEKERIEVLTLTHKLSNRQLFAVVQRKATDMLVSKDWVLWSQSAAELMESQEFNQKINDWLSTFGFGATALAGKDMIEKIRIATSAGTRKTAIGHAAKRFVIFYALGTAIALACSERQASLNAELERRKQLITSDFYN